MPTRARGSSARTRSSTAVTCEEIERSFEQTRVTQAAEQLLLAAGVLEVDVQSEVGEARLGEIRERIAEPHVAAAAGMQDRVGEHQLAVPGPHVELDDVDADGVRGVE